MDHESTSTRHSQRVISPSSVITECKVALYLRQPLHIHPIQLAVPLAGYLSVEGLHCAACLVVTRVAGVCSYGGAQIECLPPVRPARSGVSVESILLRLLCLFLCNTLQLPVFSPLEVHVELNVCFIDSSTKATLPHFQRHSCISCASSMRALHSIV